MHKLQKDVIQMSTKKDLGVICRKRHWTGFSKYSKSELVDFVCNHYKLEITASIVIQRWWKLISNRRSLCTQVNIDDVFTCEPLTECENFTIFDYNSSTKHVFNPCTLLDYVVSTGKLMNPYTRKILSHGNLQRLYIHYMNHPSGIRITYTIRNQPYKLDKPAFKYLFQLLTIIKRHKEEEQQVAEHLQMVEEECKQIITRMIQLVTELPACDPETIASVIRISMMYYIPEFIQSFIELCQLSPTRIIEYADLYLDICTTARNTLSSNSCLFQRVVLTTVVNRLRYELHNLAHASTRFVPLIIY